MSGQLTVIRRTFEASKHPKGSAERARLNYDARTSEYRPSRRYMLSDGRTFATKRMAQAWADLDELSAAPQ